MKKSINLLITLILGIVLLTGCVNKNKLDPNDFVDLIEQNNYKTTNVIDNFTTYPKIKNAFVAQNEDMTYQLEYYELETKEDAKLFFNSNKEILGKLEGAKKSTDIEADKYQKYIQSTDTAYSLITRIDNTVIYANVKPEYKDEVNKIIKTLGY